MSRLSVSTVGPGVCVSGTMLSSAAKWGPLSDAAMPIFGSNYLGGADCVSDHLVCFCGPPYLFLSHSTSLFSFEMGSAFRCPVCVGAILG